MNKSCRFALGERNGLKSAVWKIEVRKNDIYIFSTGFTREFKISLHESGNAHAGYISEYVSQNEGMRNQERHLKKWSYHRPDEPIATPVLHVCIPASQLRDYTVGVTYKKVKWISSDSRLDCEIDLYLTAPCGDIRPNIPSHLVLLDALQLRDMRWLIIFMKQVYREESEFQTLKRSITLELVEKGVGIPNDGWMILHGEKDGVATVIELALI